VHCLHPSTAPAAFERPTGGSAGLRTFAGRRGCCSIKDLERKEQESLATADWQMILQCKICVLQLGTGFILSECESNTHTHLVELLQVEKDLQSAADLGL
jgi:hypothetical protein